MIKRLLQLSAVVLMLGSLVAPLRAQEAENIVLHKVQSGDTLESLTKRYLGDAKYWRENLKLNPQIKDPRKLQPGSTIRLLTDRNIGARSAKVAQVARRVEKKPDPAQWQPATRGDRLRERDGLRTFKSSSAQLLFDDGAAVTLTEESLVFLRESKATIKGIRRDSVEIVDGQADLAVKAQKTSSNIEFIVGDSRLKAETSSTSATQTRGRKAAGGGAQVMVYSGKTAVQGKLGSVDVPSGMGTSVSPEGAPAPPEKLLPAPRAVSPAAGVETASTTFEWTPVDGAAAYVVDVCDDADCTRLAARRTGVTDTRVTFSELSGGAHFWRVAAVSRSGLDGYASSTTQYVFEPGLSGHVRVAGLEDEACAASREVYVYRDGGDGRADGADDTLVSRTKADCRSGAFTAAASGGSLWVAVAAPRVQFADGSVAIAEQTGAPRGGLCLEKGSAVVLSAAGTCFGGRDVSRTDDASKLSTADHVARVIAGEPLEFEFSFDAVTNVIDLPADQPLVQGSVRQFIANGNVLSGEHRMRFVPQVPSNVTRELVPQWSVKLMSPLPQLRPNVIFDGLAYSSDGTTPLYGKRQNELFPATWDAAPVSDLELDLTGLNVEDNGQQQPASPKK